MSSQEIENILILENHYKILGIETNSNEYEIKKKYRELAIKFHPDKNHHEKAEEAFKVINFAYETLINKESREKYDNSLKQKIKKKDEESYSNFHDTFNSFKKFNKKYNDYYNENYNYNYYSYSESYNKKKNTKSKNNGNYNFHNCYEKNKKRKKKNIFYSDYHRKEIYDAIYNHDKSAINCLLFLFIVVVVPIYITISTSNNLDIKFQKDSKHQIKYFTLKYEIPFYSNEYFEKNFNLTIISERIEEDYLEYILRKCKFKQKQLNELKYTKNIYIKKLNYNEISEIYINEIKKIIESIDNEINKIDLSVCNEYKNLLVKFSKPSKNE